MKDIDSARYAHVKNIPHLLLDSSVESDGSDAKLKWEPAIIFSMESRNSTDDCREDDQQEYRGETNTSARDVFDSIEADESREARSCSEIQGLEMEIQMDVVDDRCNEPKMKSFIDEIERSDTKLTTPLSGECDGKEEYTFGQVEDNDDGQESLCMQISTSPRTEKSVVEGKIPELMLPGKLLIQEQDASDQLDNFPHDEHASQQSSQRMEKLSRDGDQGSESGLLRLSLSKVPLLIGAGIHEEEQPIQFEKEENMEQAEISPDPATQLALPPNSDIGCQDENCKEQSSTDDSTQNENITTGLLVENDCGEEKVDTDMFPDADAQDTNNEERLKECPVNEDDGRLCKMIVHGNAVKMDNPENDSVCSGSSSDRSAKIDEKWEKLSIFILSDDDAQDVQEVDPSLELVKSNSSSSEDVDARWEKLSEQFLSNDSDIVATEETKLFQASIGEYMTEKTALTREKGMQVDSNQYVQESEVLSVLSGATNEDDESMCSSYSTDGLGSYEEATARVFSSMSHSDDDESVTGPTLGDVLSSLSEASEAETRETNLGILENRIALDAEKVASLKEVLRKLERCSQEAKQRLASRTSGSNSEKQSAVLDMEERDDTEDEKSLKSTTPSEKETTKVLDMEERDDTEDEKSLKSTTPSEMETSKVLDMEERHDTEDDKSLKSTTLSEQETSKLLDQPDSPGPFDESSAVEYDATPLIEEQVEEPQTDRYCNYLSTPSFELEFLKIPEKGSPSWRRDPAESHSDWTIEVEHSKSETVDTYHVHKHVLAFGPRRSEFLAEAFRTKSTPESCSTRFLMEDGAASMFPLLLDFIYCPAIEIDVKTENAVALRYLAMTFKVQPALAQVARFIVDDMSESNLDTYVTDNSVYEDHKVLKLIIEKCAQEIEIIEASHPVWAVMEPETFFSVISSPLIDRNTASQHLSVLVTEYQSLHQYEMDGAMFWKFTTEEILPIVDRKAALVFLETAGEYDDEEDFALLRTRCTRVLAFHWKVTSEVERRRLFALLRNLPSACTVDFLELVETGKSSTLANAYHITTHDDITSRGKKSEDTSLIPVNKYLSSESMTDVLKEEQREWSFGELSLSWRMDTQINFSDFTLEVKSSEDTVDLYHVHKHVLSIGACECRFFSSLFASAREGKTSCKQLTIELGREAAAVVPTMLDFMYSPVHELSIDTENAVALRFLARYFRLFLLNQKVVEFIREDMCLANVATYANDGKTFNDEKTLHMASLLCARQIKEIDADSDLLREVDSQFFLRVASSHELDKSAGCHLSILVVQYHTLHNLPASTLEVLLKESHMPEIDCKSGLKILQILNELNIANDSGVLNALRAQCMLVLTKNWSDFREHHRDEMFDVFPNLKSGLVCNLFDNVEKEYHAQYEEAVSLRNRLVKRYRAQLEEEKRSREEEVAAMNAKMEDIVIDMSAKNKALEDQLKRHSEASNRRIGRSNGGAYRSGIPSPSRRASGIPSPSKTSGIPTPRASGNRQTQTPRKATVPTPTRPEVVTISQINTTTTTPGIPRVSSGISGARSPKGVTMRIPPKQVSVPTPPPPLESISSAADQDLAPTLSCGSKQESTSSTPTTSSFFDFSGFGYSGSGGGGGTTPSRPSTPTFAESAQLASRSFTDVISKSWTFN